LTGISRRLIPFIALLLCVSLASSVCAPAPDRSTSTAGGTGRTVLLGELIPVVSVKELMAHMIDPAAYIIFDAVYTDSTAKGIVEHKPVTDEDWEKVETGAITLIEGIELLKVVRPFAPPGDVNQSVGPNAPELSPAQISEKVMRDPVLWNAKIQALRNVGLEILDVIKQKDAEKLFNAGSDLDEACEACHVEYWYPKDKSLSRTTP
jgi:hypothetical protein